MAEFGRPDHMFKVVLVGDSGVGKTQILERYANGQFSSVNVPTIGGDYKSKTFKHDEKVLQVHIWDTAGQERYRAIVNAYYRGASGVLLVYDITNHETFDHLENWLKELKANAPEDVSVMVIGNKIDMELSRAVSVEEGKAFSEKHKINFMETSAKDDSNVDDAFTKIVEDIYAHGRRDIRPRVDIRHAQARRAGCC